MLHSTNHANIEDVLGGNNQLRSNNLVKLRTIRYDTKITINI